MTRLTIALLIGLLVYVSPVCAQWEMSYGGSKGEYGHVVKVVYDDQGDLDGYIVAGEGNHEIEV